MKRTKNQQTINEICDEERKRNPKIQISFKDESELSRIHKEYFGSPEPPKKKHNNS